VWYGSVFGSWCVLSAAIIALSSLRTAIVSENGDVSTVIFQAATGHTFGHSAQAGERRVGSL
jgi:hypothetical protein